MASKVSWKVFQYKVADSLDKVRLPNNPRALVRRENNTVCIQFNRPRFLNCLDQSVILPVATALSDIIKNGNTELVLLEGSKAGSKLYSFTTGGDLLMGRNIIRRHEKYGTIAESERLYLVNIYRAQHYLHHLHSLLPVVSLMNGAVMGSGTMFGLNSTWSVATERTVWSLPEVSIGGMPDVGALYHMYRRHDQLGTMLALTGYRLTSSSIVHAGLASHFCKSELLPKLKQEILFSQGDNRKIKEVLDDFQDQSLNKTKEKFLEDSLATILSNCDAVYNTNDLGDILYNLNVRNDDWSKQQVTLINKACPLSLRVTLRLLRELESCKADYDTSLVRSYMVAGNIYFYGQMRAGIENVMVYRGKRKADWKMRKVEDVPDTLVNFMFENEFKEQILTLEQLRDLDTMKPY